MRSREKILAAALELFSREGYQNVSVSQIATQAGVAKGLLYNYFSSKEDMLMAIIGWLMADMFEFLTGINQETDPAVKLERLIRVSFQLFREKRAFYTTVMPLLTQRVVSEKMHATLSGFLGEFIQELASTLQQAGVPDARMEAYRLGALIDGVAWHYLFLFPEQYPLDEVEAYLTRHVSSILPKT